MATEERSLNASGDYPSEHEWPPKIPKPLKKRADDDDRPPTAIAARDQSNQNQSFDEQEDVDKQLCAIVREHVETPRVERVDVARNPSWIAEPQSAHLLDGRRRQGKG